MIQKRAIDNRIADAGADVARIAQTSVLIKLDELPPEKLRDHPVWPLCRSLGALGFGTLYIQGAIDYFEHLAHAMPHANLIQTPGIWSDDDIASTAPGADFIVDLTNDPESKSLCASLCRSRSAHLISLAFGSNWMGVRSIRGNEAGSGALHCRLGGPPTPIPAVSRIASGALLQEILIIAGAITQASPPESEIVYNVATKDRSGWDEPQAWESPSLTNQTLDVIGAGAVGVHALESLATLLGEGCELRVFDFDVVGPENLPLQIAYTRDDLGCPKAEKLSEKLLCSASQNLRIKPFCVRYEERPRDLSPPSVRVAAPDNYSTRSYVNDCSLEDGIPLVEAGSSPLAAQQRTYVPGRTACLACRIQKLAERSTSEAETASCSRVRALTLPGVNAVVGGIVATEVLRAVQPEVFGYPETGTITYDTRVGGRFGIVGRRPPCKHQRVPGSCGFAE